jgi:glycosyltransferase involved in cell wall biosynthesis
MKVLHVIPYLSPKFGGTVHSVALLSRELAGRGHRVSIATSDHEYDQDYARALERDSVEVVSFPVAARFGLFVYTPSMTAWLDRNIGNYDVVHLHEFRSYQNAVVTRAASKHGIPVVLQAHGSVLPFFEKRLLKRVFDLVWGDRILANASAAIALCEGEAGQYRAMGVAGERVEVIPNGIDLSQFSDTPPKGTFRSRFRIPAGEKIILFLGRIHRIKGVDLLIDAYVDLVRENPETTLVIAGPDDNTVPELRAQIRSSGLAKEPLFTGPLYGQEKLAAYVDADLYVLPSRYEAFGYTVLEAWACGTPVIVTDGCLIADTVERAGRVAERSPSGLKNAIVSLMSNERLRRELGETGRALVHAEFSNSSVIDRVVVLYARVAGGRDTGPGR